MSEDGLSEGIVTRADLTELAAIFDQFEFAFDPLSPAAKEAESQFENRVRKLFDDKVITVYPNLSYPLFHNRIRYACRTFLRKNSPS